MKAGVYLVTDGTNRYKIGETKDLERRLKELNGRQAPRPNTLVAFFPCKNHKEYQDQLHEKYKSNRQHGEWFDFTQLELKTVLKDFQTKKESKENFTLNLILIALLLLILAIPAKFFDPYAILQFFQIRSEHVEPN